MFPPSMSGNSEFDRLLAERERAISKMLSRMALSTVVQQQTGYDPESSFNLAGPLVFEPVTQAPEIRSTAELLGAARHHGIEGADRMHPDELNRIVAAKRRRAWDVQHAREMDLDETIYEVGKRLITLVPTAFADQALEAAGRIPFAGDAIARTKAFKEADEWLAMLEEGALSGIRTGRETVDGAGWAEVASGTAGMAGYIVPAAAAWKLAGAAGAMPGIATIGARVSPIGRAAIRGGMAEWLIEGGGDAPLEVRALNVGLGTVFGMGSAMHGQMAMQVTGAGIGGLVGSLASEGDPVAALAGAAAGYAGGKGLHRVLDKLRRSFPSRADGSWGDNGPVVDAEWEFDDGSFGSAGSLGAGPKLLGPGAPQIGAGPRQLGPGPDPDVPQMVVVEGTQVPTLAEIPEVQALRLNDDEVKTGLQIITPGAREQEIATAVGVRSYAAVAPGVIKTEDGYATFVPTQVTSIETTPFLKTTKAPPVVGHGTNYVFDEYNLGYAGALESGGITNPNAESTFVVPGIYTSTDFGTAEGFGNMHTPTQSWDNMEWDLKDTQKKLVDYMGSGKAPYYWDKQHDGDYGQMLSSKLARLEAQMDAFAKNPTVAPNVYPIKMNVQNPLNLKKMMQLTEARAAWRDAAAAGKITTSFEPEWLYKDTDWAGTPINGVDGNQFLKNMQQGAGGKAGAKEALAAAGYDGITYPGHMYSDGDGDVWLAFWPWQIYSPYAPETNSYMTMYKIKHQAQPAGTPSTEINPAGPPPMAATQPSMPTTAPAFAPSYAGQKLPIENNMWSAVDKPGEGLPMPPEYANADVMGQMAWWGAANKNKTKPMAPQQAAVDAIQLTKQATVMESPALAPLSTVQRMDDADVAWATVESYPGQLGVVKGITDPETTFKRILNDQMPNGVGPEDFRVVAVGGMKKQPPLLLDADHVFAGKVIGEQQGSNYGFTVTAKDGMPWYVKKYQNPSMAGTENIANAIYRELGIAVPETGLVKKDGEFWHASELIGTKAPFGNQLGENMDLGARAALEGFAADVFLANWDAAGLYLDNMMYGADGMLYRIDNGGSLLFRGMGERKPSDALKNVTEWQNFAPGGLNKEYRRIFKAAGINSGDEIPGIVSQIDDILQLSKAPGGWRGFVDRYGDALSEAEKVEVVDMLDTRAAWLYGKRQEIAAKIGDTREAPIPAPSPKLGDGARLDLIVSSGRPITDDMVRQYEQTGLFEGQRVTLATGQEAVVYKPGADVTTVYAPGGGFVTPVPTADLMPGKASALAEDIPGLYESFQQFGRQWLDSQSQATSTAPLDFYGQEAATQMALMMDDFLKSQGAKGAYGALLRQSLEQQHIKALRNLAPVEDLSYKAAVDAELQRAMLERGLPPSRLEDFAAARGMEWRPEERSLVEISTGMRVPVDSEAAAMEFLRNFVREPLDDAPLTPYPLEMIDTPLGYSETRGRGNDEWVDGHHREDAYEEMVEDLEAAMGGRGGGGGGQPPFGAGGPDDGPLRLPPSGSEKLAGQWRRARKTNPRKFNDLIARAGGIVTDLFRDMRSHAIMLESYAKQIGVEDFRPYFFMQELESAHARMINQSEPWKNRAFESIRGVRNKFVRDGTLWEAINARDDVREAIMKNAGMNAKERRAVANFDAVMQDFWPTAQRAFPEMGRHDNYISWMNQWEAQLPGQARRTPGEAKWGPENERGPMESTTLEKDVSTIIPRYFDGFFKLVEMQPAYDAFQRHLSTAGFDDKLESQLGVIYRNMKDWADARMWGLDPAEDIVAKGLRGVLDTLGRPLGIRVTMDDVMKLSYGFFGNTYRAALGGRLDPLFRDLPQLFIGGMHVGLDRMMPTMIRLLRDDAYRQEAMQRALDAGSVQRGHALTVDADVFGGNNWKQPDMVEAFGETAARRREQIAGLGDVIADATPDAMKGGLQGKWYDPLKAYGALGDFARLVLHETGYQSFMKNVGQMGDVWQMTSGGARLALEKQILKATRTGRFQGPIQDMVMDHLRRGDIEGAAQKLGYEVANSQNRYGMTQHAQRWRRMGPVTGRLFMHFGTFNQQTLANNAQILRDPRIDPMDKAAYAVQVGALQVAFTIASVYTGWNFAKMTWEGLASVQGQGGFGLWYSIMRANALLESMHQGSELTPEQRALVGSGQSDFGSKPWSLDPANNSLNPWRGVFQSVEGFGQAAQWGPEALVRYPVTGQRTDPWVDRMQKRGLSEPTIPPFVPPAPMQGPPMNSAGGAVPRPMMYPDQPRIAGGGAF